MICIDLMFQIYIDFLSYTIPIALFFLIILWNEIKIA